MSFPPGPPPIVPNGAPVPSGPPGRRSPLVPLLIVGAIALVTLLAGAAAAIMIVMMHSGAFSPLPPVRDTPPVVQAPPPDAPPEPEPAPERTDRTPSSTPAARQDPARQPAARPPAAERSRRDTADEEPDEGAVRVGGPIPAPAKIHDVRPVYPPIAVAARVQGRVIVDATIGVDGRITQTRVVTSVPLLDQAALDAVRQWRYAPTVIDGTPRPVIVRVTVNFTLR